MEDVDDYDEAEVTDDSSYGEPPLDGETPDEGEGRPARRVRSTDDVLVAALVNGMSYAEAARVVGVSTKTVTRRMQERTFRERVRIERRARLDELVNFFDDTSLEAARVLQMLMHDAEKDATRLAAAKALLSFSMSNRQQHELQAELQELRQEMMERRAAALEDVDDE